MMKDDHDSLALLAPASPELGTAQPQLVFGLLLQNWVIKIVHKICQLKFAHAKNMTFKKL